MGFELFGNSAGPYFATACVTAYIVVGHRSVYSGQLLGYSKSLWVRAVPDAPLEPGKIHISYSLLRRLGYFRSNRWRKQGATTGTLMNEFFQWILKHSKPWDSQPQLSDAELEELFELMSDNEELSKSAMGMEMADGYMTASVVGPDPLPTPWLLEAIFDQPTLPLPHDSERQLRLLQLLLRRHADIQASTALRSDEVTLDNVFMPLMGQVPAEECIKPYRLDEKHERIGRWELQDWGEGFHRAIAEDDAWEPLLSDPEVGGLVSPVVLYSMGYNPDCLDLQIDEDHELLPLLSVSMCAMRSWWRDYHRRLDAAAIPFQRGAPKVGRNDPCPCGSGKKYKKCCGA